MFHPLEPDLSSLKDSDIEEKLRELTKKYNQAARLNNQYLLTQVGVFVNIYRNELSNRMLAKNKNNDTDLDQLIHVE